jgi:hypothetical protein
MHGAPSAYINDIQAPVERLALDDRANIKKLFHRAMLGSLRV